MRLQYQVLLPLLGLFLGREIFTASFPLEIAVEVHRVVDGDTLEVRSGGALWTIRLAGVDAPESGQPTRLGHQSAGQFAKRCLARSVQPGSWRLHWQGRDHYGRVLGDLRRGKRSLCLELIQQGCVSVYPFLTGYSRQEKRRLNQSLEWAKTHRRGLWAMGGFQRPYYWRKLQKTRRTPVAKE